MFRQVAFALTCLVLTSAKAASPNILETLPRHTNYKDLHKLEGHKVKLKCQLYDGSVWSKCVWKHGQNSAVIDKNHEDGGSYQVSPCINVEHIIL